MLNDKIYAAAACGVFFANAAQAEVLYSTFGAGDAFNANTMWVNGTDGFGYHQVNASSFTLGAGTWDTIEIDLPLSWEDSPNATFFSFQIKVYAADGIGQDTDEIPIGGAPGTELASLNLSAGLDIPQRPLDGHPSITTFEIEDLVLAGNATYWVAIEPAFDDGIINWHTNSSGVSGFKSQQLSPNSGDPLPGTWTMLDPGLYGNDGAMRVHGTLVPTPSAAALGLLGLAGCTVRRRR